MDIPESKKTGNYMLIEEVDMGDSETMAIGMDINWEFTNPWKAGLTVGRMIEGMVEKFETMNPSQPKGLAFCELMIGVFEAQVEKLRGHSQFVTVKKDREKGN